jgi:hypothetical protein
MYATMIQLIKKLNTIPHITIKYMRCDDAGENKAFEKQNIAASLGLIFEYTGPGSPQYNGRVERKFSTFYSRDRSMLNSANLPEELSSGLWAKAANTATDIENSLVSVNKALLSYRAFSVNEYPSIQALHPFGELAVVDINAKHKIRNMLANRDRDRLYLGRATNHRTDARSFLKFRHLQSSFEP